MDCYYPRLAEALANPCNSEVGNQRNFGEERGLRQKNKKMVHGVIAVRLRRRCGREGGRDGVRGELCEARVQGEVW